MTRQIKKIVLAYSGGLDTSVILKWLIETYDCQVIAFAADIGQGEELDSVRGKALDTGAAKVVIEDLKEDFVRDYVFPAFRANAVYEGQYLLGTSLARPLIAKRQIEVARTEGADGVSHGATGKGNDQVRFELTYQALAPELKIIAPWRVWHLSSRQSLMNYAKEHGIRVAATQEKPYSMDRNMLHVSYEGGILEDPWESPPEDMFTMSVSSLEAPDRPEVVEVSFERGDPVAVNGEMLSPAELLGRLNTLGGRNGIGRVDLVENRFVGIKSRGVYETPGGMILRVAHMAIESITMDREVMHLRDSLVPKYAELVYYGFWFSPEMKVLQAMMDETQETVSGTARLELYKGNCRVLGRKSDNSLYRRDFATFEADQVYRQQDAEGFIRLNALRLRIQAMTEKVPKVN
ncbi:MAG: argininosuccinate synthase [Deltaproteobacteria bacterium]|nr:argininosuccinate synthase [Deltaproteobacteria bacterium]MBW2329500.1 argininosuccinate synthase [Deltaproteobacteria bacterium]